MKFNPVTKKLLSGVLKKIRPHTRNLRSANPELLYGTRKSDAWREIFEDMHEKS